MEEVKSSVEELPLASMSTLAGIPGSYMVLEWGRGLDSWFWSPSFWLPEGYSWEDLKSTEHKQYPEFREILTYPVVFALFILAFRFYILNPFLFEPFARRAGLKYKRYVPPPRNDYLEKLLDGRSNLPEKELCAAAKKLGWTTREVERWVRQKKQGGKLTKLDKFQESVFITSYHIIISIYGLYIMIGKPWLKDISHTWLGYPLHEIDNWQWWYYIISVSFYFALCVSHLRCGLTSYFHHACTILLLVFSWSCNLVRVGSLVLLIHECGDIFLQSIKICQYLKKQRAADVLLPFFLIVWISTRVILFPFWVFKNMYFEAPKFIFMPAGYMFYVLLLGLLALNVLWTGMIGLVIVKSCLQGRTVEDIRSAESSNDGNDENEKVKDQ